MICPTWFGPPEKPLFGVMHVPDAALARGAVVICAPVGREHITTYRGVKQLAEKLCRNGLLVLRFDYCGLGDSFGEQATPNAVSDWCDSIVEAVRYVRTTGVRDVAVVGLRLGALLAAASSARCGDLCALVLWDPVLSGRHYVREQRAAHRFSCDAASESEPVADGDEIELLGISLHASTTRQLSALSLDKLVETSACEVLCGLRSETRDAALAPDLIEKIGASIILLDQQSGFVTPPSFVFSVPTAAIEKLAMAIARSFPHTTTAVRVVACNEAKVTVGNGDSIVETITFSGDGIFSLRTAPCRQTAEVRTVVFQGTASEHRIGPSRLWTELSRQLAASGVTAVRYDRCGIGDSGMVADNESTPTYSASARRDAMAIVRALALSPAHLVLAGVCSGAWHSAYVAREFGARAVVMISAADWSIKARPRIRRAHIDAMQSSVATRLFEGARTLRDGVRRLQQRIPYRVWRILGLCRLVQVPELLLDALWRRDVQTTVILTPEDRTWFELQRGPEGLVQLRQRGYPGVLIQRAEGDHSLYARNIREFARAQVLQAVAATFVETRSGQPWGADGLLTGPHTQSA